MYLFSFELNGRVNYLLGSWHSLPFESLPKRVQEFILSRNSLVSEHGAFSTRLKELGCLEDNAEPSENFSAFAKVVNTFSSIKINLTPDQIKSIDTQIADAAARFGVTASSLTIKGIASFAYMIKQGNGNSMDSEISKRFKASQKEELYLEGTEVIDLIADPITCIISLTQLLTSTNPISIDNLPQIYAAGVISEYMLSSNIQSFPEVFKVRNQKWLSGDEEYDGIHVLHSKLTEAVFAVGSGHLFGEFGILMSLLQSGYKICRIDDNLDQSVFTSEDLILLESRGVFNDFKYGIPNMNGCYYEHELDIIAWTAIEDQDTETLAKLSHFLN